MNINLFDDTVFSYHERENHIFQTDEMNGFNREISRFPENTPLAMAYVPFQQWGKVYDADEAINRGTLFPELDLPFGGGYENE